MKHRVHRLLGSLALLVAAAIVFAAPVSAASPRRVWHATISGSHGSASVTLWPNLTGSTTVTVRGLQPNRTYQSMIYQGTCAQPTPILKLNGVRTDASGNGTRDTIHNRTGGNALWAGASRGTLGVRVASGTEYFCGLIEFPVATRIQISRYGINLPIVTQPPGTYPYCNVAMYLTALSQPGEAGPTFIYAHARTGMFLPLLTASKVNNGRAMVGTTVRVWTSDSRLYTYALTRVLRRQFSIPSYDPNVEQLFLQTSEGPHGTKNKLVIVGKRISVENATFAASHPTPHIVRCGF